MSKDDYREYFGKLKGFIVFKPFLKDCEIAPSSFSKFLKSDLFNYTMDIEKLEKLEIEIKEFCRNA